MSGAIDFGTLRAALIALLLCIGLLSVALIIMHRSVWLAIEHLRIVARNHDMRMDDIERGTEHD